jgi:acid phosphatase
MAMPPYMTSPLSLGNLQGTDYLNAMPSLDLPDHRSTFDSETFVRWVICFSKWDERGDPLSTGLPC